MTNRIDCMDLDKTDIIRLRRLVDELEKEINEGFADGLAIPIKSIDGDEWLLCDDWDGKREE